NASSLLLYFFFQAEDGIRDFHVTGVQTCALPIFISGSLNTVQTVDSLKEFIKNTFPKIKEKFPFLILTITGRSPSSDLKALCQLDRKSTRLNSSHVKISYAVFCLKKKNTSKQLHH